MAARGPALHGTVAHRGGRPPALGPGVLPRLPGFRAADGTGVRVLRLPRLGQLRDGGVRLRRGAQRVPAAVRTQRTYAAWGIRFTLVRHRRGRTVGDDPPVG